MADIFACNYLRIDRKFSKNIVLLPGWATDYRIFGGVLAHSRLSSKGRSSSGGKSVEFESSRFGLRLDYNYFLPINFNPYNFEQECLKLLKENNIEKISLFGWSLGGNVAFQFAIKYPELVEKLILVSVKPKYETDGIEKIKSMLKRNKNAYLIKFYQQCFSDDEKDEYVWFKNNLLKYYLDEFKTEDLIRDLDYLLNNPFTLHPSPFTLTFIHGSYDKIVPVTEIDSMKSLFTAANYKIIKNCGHLPFLSKNML